MNTAKIRTQYAEVAKLNQACNEVYARLMQANGTREFSIIEKEYRKAFDAYMKANAEYLKLIGVE